MIQDQHVEPPPGGMIEGLVSRDPAVAGHQQRRPRLGGLVDMSGLDPVPVPDPVRQPRLRGDPDPAEAFTFTLVNLERDAHGMPVDRQFLDHVYHAVRDDRPDEDDVILLGDLGASGGGSDATEALSRLTAAISDTPTTLQGGLPTDNILFDPRATTEFTGRAGVLDLMRELELTWREVSEVSEHLPVWAEFSPHEGGGYGHVADLDRRTAR